MKEHKMAKHRTRLIKYLQQEAQSKRNQQALTGQSAGLSVSLIDMANLNVISLPVRLDQVTIRSENKSKVTRYVNTSNFILSFRPTNKLIFISQIFMFSTITKHLQNNVVARNSKQTCKCYIKITWNEYNLLAFILQQKNIHEYS